MQKTAAGMGSDDAVETAIRILHLLDETLESSWRHGTPPVMRLEAAIEQFDADERSRIETSASRLSVRLLMPTGLCFLPAFIFIGVIPSIASFVM